MSWHPEYSVHPAVAYAAAVIRNMPAKTGRSMEEWVQLAMEEGPQNESESREWLRDSYGLGMTTASGIASFAFGDGRSRSTAAGYLEAAPGYVDAMFAGKKAHLRPVLERLLTAASDLPGPVRICPTRTTVALYRTHKFANIMATTQKRVDLGLSIRSAPLPDHPRLIDTGGAKKKDRITYRIALQSPDEVDEFVLSSLARAFGEDTNP